jgi:hypothetical protein
MAKTPNTKTTPAAQPADVSFATSAAPPQQPQGEGGAEGVDSGATTAVAAPTENGTVPTIPPESDSTNSTGAVDQAGESQPQPPQGESGADIISSSVADQLAPAKAESLDLWVKNNGVFSKTEPRSKVLLGAGQVTQIKITSAVMRQTIKRNIEQMNHLAGGRLMVLVDQPVVEEGN